MPATAAKTMSVNDAQLRSFLLRRLPPAETARLEEAILLEDGFAERLRDEEFDLLDDYAALRLNDEDRAAVERHLLGLEGKLHSLRIAHALRRQESTGTPTSRSRVARGSAPRRTAQRIAQAAGLLAACAVAVALIPQWRGDSPHPEAARGSAAPAAATGPGAAAPGAAMQARALPIVMLVADVARGGPRPALRIPHGAAAIRLQTEVPEPAENVAYGIRITDAAGKPLFKASGLAVQVAGPYRFVEAEVPLAALGPGERAISLTAAGAGAGAGVTAFSWQVTGVVE
jgi:hypothetical protein